MLFAGAYSQTTQPPSCLDQPVFGETDGDKLEMCQTFATSDPCGCTYVPPSEGCSAAACPSPTAQPSITKTTAEPSTTPTTPEPTTPQPTTPQPTTLKPTSSPPPGVFEQDCGYW